MKMLIFFGAWTWTDQWLIIVIYGGKPQTTTHVDEALLEPFLILWVIT